MDHHKLVLPEYLNHHGHLFGGYLLKWIDEVAFITAQLDYPTSRLVTVAMDNVVFKHKIMPGDILRFAVNPVKKGTSSVHYQVQVFGKADPATVLFETQISFVNVDESGLKKPL